MKTQEIPSKDWPAFCHKCTDLNRGSLLSLEILDAAGHKNVIARELPLRHLRFHKTAGCSDEVLLGLGESGGRQVDHVIIEPIRIILRVEAGPKTLEIEAESGMNFISFHLGQFPEPTTKETVA